MGVGTAGICHTPLGEHFGRVRPKIRAGADSSILPGQTLCAVNLIPGTQLGGRRNGTIFCTNQTRRYGGEVGAAPPRAQKKEGRKKRRKEKSKVERKFGS